MLSAASHLPEDPALLKAMVAELQAENAKLTTTLRAHDLVVQALRLQIAKLKKQAFGKSSEKIQREIEQLELALEDMLVSAAQQGLVASDRDDPDAAASADTSSGPRPSRRPRVSADIRVCIGPDEAITALTDHGLEELTDMLSQARLTTKTWHQFLDDFVDDPELAARFKAQPSR